MKKQTNNITEIVFILDRSGSMGGLENDTIGGFNAMLKEQKEKDGKAFVTTVLFDHERFTLHDRLPIEKVPEMTAKDYTVRGCTALLDAIGYTIEHIKRIHHYARKRGRPGKNDVRHHHRRLRKRQQTFFWPGCEEDDQRAEKEGLGIPLYRRKHRRDRHRQGFWH